VDLYARWIGDAARLGVAGGAAKRYWWQTGLASRWIFCFPDCEILDKMHFNKLIRFEINDMSVNAEMNAQRKLR